MGECKCNKNRRPVENGGDKAWDICDECMKKSEENRKRNEEGMKNWNWDD